jgi:hypothetical protein
VCPPLYWAAGLALLAAVLSSSGILLALRGGGIDKSALLVIVACGIPFLLISVGFAATWATAVFDGPGGRLEIRQRMFGFSYGDRTLPLATVRLAFVERGTGTGRLAIQLSDGTAVPLGFLTSAEGRQRAEMSINRFLAVR